MRRNMMKVMTTILTFMMLFSMVGCSKKEGKSTNVDTNESQVKENDGQTEKTYPKVTWYIRPSAQQDMDIVVEELNKIFREKVGAELEIKRVDPGDYNQKMMTTIAAGEKFDMMHSAPRYGFYDNVAKGAYLPLDDLLKEYAPKTYANIKSEFWDAVKVDGKIYGVINYQIFGRENGFRVRKDVYDALDLSSKEIKTFEDMDEILVKMAEIADGDDIVFNMNKEGLFNNSLTYYGLDPIDNDMGVIRIGDNKPVAENRYATEEFKAYVNMMHKWYKSGYIPKDSPTREYSREFVATGRIMASWDNHKPGDEYEVNTLYGTEMEYIPSETPFVNTQNVIATMTSLSHTSPNPEKAMQILELVNTDPEVYNLLINGIEGKHYKKVGDNRIEPISNSGYAPNCGWMVGNQFNAYLLPGQPDDVWEKTIEVNESATISSAMGLSIDITSVKNEYVQCKSVLDEYLPALVTGAVDADKHLSDMLDKLEQAGIQKIIDEENRQIQEFLSAQ